jgi:lipopolysaccharide export system permease protein
MLCRDLTQARRKCPFNGNLEAVTLLDRYLIAAFLRNFFPAWLGLAVLFYTQAMIAELLEQPYPAAQILYRGLLTLPQIFLQIAPPAVLAGTVMTLSGLGRTGELTGFFSLGFGRPRMVAVLASVTLVICSLLLAFQDRLAPLFVRKRTAYTWQVMKKRPDFFLDFKKDKIWYRSRNLIFNLKSFDAAQKTIYGMSIYTLDEGFRLVQLVDAARGVHTKDGWKLLDGTVTVFDSDRTFPLSQKFDEKELPLQETPQDFQEIEKEVDTLRLSEHWQYIRRSAAAGVNTRAFEVSFHSRVAMCFIPVVMCILGIPFALRSQRSGGMGRDLGIALAVTFFYWLFFSLGLSLGKNGVLPPWFSAWGPSLLFGALALFLVRRRTA